MRWLPPVAIVLYTTALLVWLRQNGGAVKIRLCRVKRNCPQLTEIVLFLMIFPAYNFWSSTYLERNPAVVAVVASACLVEEIFFRGFLLHYLKRHGVKTSVLISSGLFALYHLGNLLAIQDTGYVLLQTISAFSAGVCYAVAVLVTDSLIPCVLAHILTNLTATPDMGRHTFLLLVCIVLSCFSYYFLKEIKRS